MGRAQNKLAVKIQSEKWDNGELMLCIHCVKFEPLFNLDKSDQDKFVEVCNQFKLWRVVSKIYHVAVKGVTETAQTQMWTNSCECM